jgi:hypothetical protein
MSNAVSRVVMAAALVCATAVVSQAQQTTTATETKAFEILAVDGKVLVVRLPEGTRELIPGDDFRVNVDGKMLAVSELKPGMKGTAVITTKTTVTPVTVTEVKNGTVVQTAGSTIIVRTDEGIKSFTQGEIDKRGVKIMRSGKPAQLSDFRAGDRLSATIITSKEPQVLTEKDVQASATAAPAPRPPAAAPAPAAPPPAQATASASAAPSPARTLPKTASSWPLLGLASVLSLAMGLALTARRRFVR